MQRPFTWSIPNSSALRPQWRLWTSLTLILVVFGMTGCSSGGGGDSEVNPSCNNQSINNFMNAQVAEVITGLTFTFVDGGSFKESLAGQTPTLTIDDFTDPVITLTVATADHMAIGETTLVPCFALSNPACLFDVTITESSFPSDEGPQLNDVFVLQDWRLTARLDECVNRVTATMIAEDDMGVSVASEPLDLGPTELCPMIGTCP